MTKLEKLVRVAVSIVAFVLFGVLMDRAGGPNRLNMDHYHGPMPNGTLQIIALGFLFLGLIALPVRRNRAK